MMFSPYESVINELLYFVFKNCLSRNTFSDVSRKTNEVPVYKKGDKEKLKNYRLVSLLLICGKKFEKLSNALYSFSVDHKLLNLCQSRSDVLRGSILDIYLFCFILMIFVVIYQLILNPSLMIILFFHSE